MIPFAMQIDTIRQRTLEAFHRYMDTILAALPGLVGGLVVLLVGYGIAALLRWITMRVLRSTGLARLAEGNGLDNTLAAFGGAVVLLGRIVFYVVMLFFILAAAEVMGLTLLIDGLRELFAYLPRLLAASAVFLAGLWLGRKVRGAIDGLTSAMGVSGGRIVGRLVFGVIVLFMSITALNIAGMDTSLITSNITLLIGGTLLSFAIAYGFASRDVLTNLLGSFYGRDRFEPGMRVRIGADEGVIERIDSIAMTLRTADRLVVIPASMLVSSRIEVLADPAATNTAQPLR